MSPLIRPDYVREVFDRQTDIALVNLRNINDACGDKIDVDPRLLERFRPPDRAVRAAPRRSATIWTPYYRKMNDWIHANTNWKTLKHCCGAVVPLIPCFIEAGFDILNPVQTSAAEMDPATAEAANSAATSCSGEAASTPRRCCRSARPRRCAGRCWSAARSSAGTAGSSSAPSHNVQKGVPIENIVAMIDAVREFNGERV